MLISNEEEAMCISRVRYDFKVLCCTHLIARNGRTIAHLVSSQLTSDTHGGWLALLRTRANITDRIAFSEGSHFWVSQKTPN